MYKYFLALGFTLSTSVLVGCASDTKNVNESKKIIDTVKLHPLFEEFYKCSEHWDGQFKHLGDALGSDCVIEDWYKDGERLFMHAYKNNGYENEDWFGWQKIVLAPCTCEVVKVHVNPVTNQPGIMTPGRASSITFKRDDGVFVLIAHIDNPNVEVGDKVTSGQPVALVGNNGYSRNPHIHIASWFDETPLQIRFDQKYINLGDRR